MLNNTPRIMICGTGSGCGKTTVTCGLLQALKQRQLNITAFKCGPDYIDPMFHSQIIGTKCRNLDLYLCGENTTKYLFAENSVSSDIAVVEGVMGIYDGLGFDSDDYSANHIARVLGIPQILVVNVRGKSRSLLAELSGYLNFAPNNIKGVILNSCSKAMYEFYKNMIENSLDIKVYGYMENLKAAEISSRHLGLITAEEIVDLKDKISLLGDAAEKSLQLDEILELGKKAEAFNYELPEVKKSSKDIVKIGVARDKAFSFYYEDNFQLLRNFGAIFEEFSPLEDEHIPENLSGIILGGGYPEEYLRKLSENKSMRESIKQAVADGMPVYAECGGFMYLGKSIEKDGTAFEMVGVLDSRSHMTQSLVRFGYKSLTANIDNIMCRKGEKIRCHEFHYSDSDNNGDGFTAEKSNGRQWQEIIATDSIFAGYPHLHLWSNPEFGRNFVEKCKEYRRR